MSNADQIHHIQCGYCDDWMDAGVLVAHIIRKHKTMDRTAEAKRHKKGPKSRVQPKIDYITENDYTKWKENMRRMIGQHNDFITSMLTKFSVPFGKTLRPDMLVARQFKKVMEAW